MAWLAGPRGEPRAVPRRPWQGARRSRRRRCGTSARRPSAVIGGTRDREVAGVPRARFATATSTRAAGAGRRGRWWAAPRPPRATRGHRDPHSAYERKPLRRGAAAGLRRDRRPTAGCASPSSPFLDADETSTAAREPRSGRRAGAAHEARPPGGRPARLPVVEAALKKETVPCVRHALEEALGADSPGRTGDARRPHPRRPVARGAALVRTRVPALQRLAADTGGARPSSRRRARGAIRQHRALGAASPRRSRSCSRALSLSSILLLMALGLAIVFGLMGVINMAHGELMALGAYATFVVQGWFPRTARRLRLLLPGRAARVSFLVAASVGFLLERGVIRFLYGRPLETLLLTWGVSLMIQQGLRALVRRRQRGRHVAPWLSGGIPVMIGAPAPVQPALHHRAGHGLRGRACTCCCSAPTRACASAR